MREFDYDNVPIVDIVNDIISDSLKRGASDIHFDPTPESLVIRIRIDGDLLNYAVVPDSVRRQMTTRIKNMAKMNITESRTPQDGAIKDVINGYDVDLRVSCLPLVTGEKIVIRILDYSMSLEGLETLGFSDENFTKVEKMISVPNGIILVTGATGSGKSTTVYSILQRLNRVERNLITVEDPVEMKIPGVNQVQVISEIGMTFAAALRSILRQDPDIVMIGEIRDNETASIAVRASITGHLVLSTLHTNNALNTIERLVDMEVERYLLGASLVGIIAQRLTKRLCPHCRIKRNTTKYEKMVFEKALKKKVDTIYSPNEHGCEHCVNGYHGRIPVHEVLLINQEIRDAIINNLVKKELRKLIYEEQDVISLLQDGLEKVIEGITSFEEILRVIDVADDVSEDDYELKQALLGNLSSAASAAEIKREQEAIKRSQVAPVINLQRQQPKPQPQQSQIQEQPKVQTQMNNVSTPINKPIQPTNVQQSVAPKMNNTNISPAINKTNQTPNINIPKPPVTNNVTNSVTPTNNNATINYDFNNINNIPRSNKPLPIPNINSIPTINNQ